jgi:hypothetical protein
MLDGIAGEMASIGDRVKGRLRVVETEADDVEEE